MKRLAARAYLLALWLMRRLGLEVRELADVRGRHAGLRVLARRDEPGFLRGAVKSFSIDGTALRFFVENDLDVIQGHHRRGLIYEAEELALIAGHYRGEGSFIDVGGNVGNHAIYAAKVLRAPRVIAFEPLPLAADILEINLALNGCTGIVEVRRLALSDAKGFAEAQMQVFNLGGTRLAESSHGAIALARGDDLLAEEDIGFVKIDAEGMEMKVLAGLSATIARCRPPLFVELLNCHIGPFEDFCASREYRVAATYRRDDECINYLAVPDERS